MLHKFGVIRTLDRDTRVFVCGSANDLGSWNPDRAVELGTTRYVLDEPSFWTVEIEISESQCPFEYKFLCKDGERVEWEGMDNRRSNADGETNDDQAIERRLLNPSWWREPNEPRSEFNHTVAFYYKRVVNDGGIHFSQILDNLWLGSCPRQPYHISALKNLGVDTIMNFQTESDILNNSAGVLNHHDKLRADETLVDRLEETYRRSNIAFVWLPTTDMCSQARRRMLPQAVTLLRSLMANGRRVYIHCNAGVGRAGAAAAGYLMYARGMSLKDMMYFLYDKRPAVYVDKEALREAKKDYQLKYCKSDG
jgi:atypical dual specificity phosphatase